MATKIKLMKLLQEMRGLSEMRRWHRAPKPAALYLMQLRTHVAETSNARRRLVISIDLKDTAAVPDSVTIRHTSPMAPVQIRR